MNLKTLWAALDWPKRITATIAAIAILAATTWAMIDPLNFGQFEGFIWAILGGIGFFTIAAWTE